MGNIVYNGFHKIEEIETNMKGNRVKREKLHLKNGIGALVTDKYGRVALVKQFRPCTGEYMYEIPAGCIDKEGKTPKEILIEELQEECSIRTCDIQSVSEKPFREYYMVCGSTDAVMQLYRIKTSHEGVNSKVCDNDVDEVIWVTEKELLLMDKKGMLKDPKTILSLKAFTEELGVRSGNEQELSWSYEDRKTLEDFEAKALYLIPNPERLDETGLSKCLWTDINSVRETYPLNTREKYYWYTVVVDDDCTAYIHRGWHTGDIVGMFISTKNLDIDGIRYL